MPLAAGDKLGPYEILALIGKGGMGEVYRAHDARLRRDVAIKVSTEQFNERFAREARAVAALNHPHICTLHDIGPNYLVMELIEGESPKGPLPLGEALRIAAQIAAALEAAHEKGIVHRDLKPANIKIKPDGTVKVLDFGLAKVILPAPEDSATLSITEAGVVLGTAAYMSPEQARGKPVDKRTDVWAFGVVLYELLTGKRPFRGDTLADVLSAVVSHEPDLSRIPPQAHRLIKTCLQKDPANRLHDIADVKLLLEDEAPAERPRPSRRLPWVAAAVLAVALGVALWAPWRSPPTAEPIRTQIFLPDDVKVEGNRNFTLSPDERVLAFSALGPDGVARVWVRFMDAPPLEVRMLSGTETTPTPPQFFWSPDGKRIAYSADGAQLRTVDLTGSPPQTLVPTTGPNATGGSWNRDGVLLYGSTNAGLTRVFESGGTPVPVTVKDDASETRHAFPTFLPDGRHFLYLRTKRSIENSGVYLGSLDAKPEEQDSRRLVATQFSPVYVASSERGRGYLLILRAGNLLAYPFDEGQLELTGDPITVVQDVGSYVASGFFSATRDVLVYRSIAANQGTALKWWGHDGSYEGDPGQSGGISAMALSPDGQRAALVRPDSTGPNGDIWSWDVARGGIARLTSGSGRNEAPVWTPDGSQVVFASNREGSWNLYRKLANESKEDELLLKTPQSKTPTSIARDGKLLLYTQVEGQNSDVWVLSLGGGAGGRKPMALLNSGFNETEARFSPESENPPWVAYTSNESGRSEVYVREYPLNASGLKWPVSKAGGSNPRWRQDGKELFFAASDGSFMSVDVTTEATFQASAPKVLGRVPSPIRPNWDVTPDGKRFLVLMDVQQAAPFTVWQNWQAALKK